jgi:hypothetical protein
MITRRPVLRMSLLQNFQPALATLTKADGQRDSHNYPLVQKVAEASARLTAESLTKRSPTSCDSSTPSR